MADFKYNRWLLAIIVLGLLAALVIGWQRHLVEESNSRVELVMDYEDILELAQTEGVPVPLMMQQFKDSGVTSLAIYETTLEKLQKGGILTVLSGADLLARLHTGEVEKFPFSEQGGAIIPSRVYIFANRQDLAGQSLFAEVKEDLMRRLGPSRIHELVTPDNRLGLSVDANYEKVLKMNLGLPTQEMRDATAHGYLIVARPSNYTKVQPNDVNAVFTRLSRFNNVSGVMFVGDEVLGYPDLLPLTAQNLRERGIALYMIEHPLQLQFLRQDGLLPLATLNNYNVARTYVIPKDEQLKMKVDEAIFRWISTTNPERNIRVNLLRKFDKPEMGMNLTETNLKYIEGLKQALLDKSFTIGKAGVYQTYFPNPWLLVVIIAGATAAGVLFLTLVKPFASRYQYLLLAIISILLSWPVLSGSGMLVRQAVATVSAIVFPVLAMTWQLDRWRLRQPFQGSLARIVADGVSGLIITVIFSLVGGIYIGAILGDVRFLLEMEIFRGVKLTFIMPLVLITLTYLVRFGIFDKHPDEKRLDIMQQLGKILNYPVYFKTLLLVALGGFAAWVYIGRSGHTAGVPVPAIEIKLRAFLESNMYARPREKEFLIGHPAFLLAVMALYRQWPKFLHYLLVIAATIGQGSLVETFAHIRTPIYMSLVRGIDGLVVGAVLGVLAVIAVQVLHYLSFLLGRRPAADE